MAEHHTVDVGVVGSSPIIHPKTGNQKGDERLPFDYLTLVELSIRLRPWPFGADWVCC